MEYNMQISSKNVFFELGAWVLPRRYPRRSNEDANTVRSAHPRAYCRKCPRGQCGGQSQGRRDGQGEGQVPRAACVRSAAEPGEFGRRDGSGVYSGESSKPPHVLG